MWFFVLYSISSCSKLCLTWKQNVLTGAPWCWSRFQRGRCGGWSWSRRHRGFHQCPRPEPRGPGACSPEPVRYSWGKRCSCAVRSPSRWKSRRAAGRWTGSPHCLCRGCLREQTSTHDCCSQAATKPWGEPGVCRCRQSSAPTSFFQM